MENLALKGGRFDHGSGGMDQGSITLVFNLATAFERVSLPVAWARAALFKLSKQILRQLCGYFEFALPCSTVRVPSHCCHAPIVCL